MLKKITLFTLPLIIYGCVNTKTLPQITEAEVHSSIQNQIKLSNLVLLEKINSGNDKQSVEYIEDLYIKSFNNPDTEQKIIMELGTLGESSHLITQKLDHIVEKNPSTSMAYLLRGKHKASAAYAARGEQSIQKTPEENIKKMIEIQNEAISDLKKAIELDQRNYLAYSLLGSIYVTRRTDISKAHESFDKSIDIKPDSYFAWSEKLWVLTPKWGGSYEKMNFAISEMNNNLKKNQYLGSLQSAVLYDQGFTAELNGDYKKAQSIYFQALAFGEDHNVLLGMGYTNIQLGKASDGCPFIRKAIKIRPYKTRHNVLFLKCEKLGL